MIQAAAIETSFLVGGSHRRRRLTFGCWADYTRMMFMKARIQMTTSFALLLTTMMLTGCSTMSDAVHARGSGPKVTYQASFDEIWAAMPEAITAAGLQFVSANRADHSILAQRGITAFSYGENVAIFVEKVSDSQSSVEVDSKKAMSTNIFAPNWANPIFEQLDKKFKRD